MKAFSRIFLLVVCVTLSFAQDLKPGQEFPMTELETSNLKALKEQLAKCAAQEEALQLKWNVTKAEEQAASAEMGNLVGGVINRAKVAGIDVSYDPGPGKSGKFTVLAPQPKTEAPKPATKK